MADHTSNDNEGAQGRGALRGPEAHGQAAILLVESLIHGLIAKAVISVEDAVEIVEVAAEVEADAGLGDSPTTMRQSLSLLGSIRSSLAADL